MVIDGADYDFEAQVKDQYDDEFVHRLLGRGELVGSDLEVEHHFRLFARINGDAENKVRLF